MANFGGGGSGVGVDGRGGMTARLAKTFAGWAGIIEIVGGRSSWNSTLFFMGRINIIGGGHAGESPQPDGEAPKSQHQVAA